MAYINPRDPPRMMLKEDIKKRIREELDKNRILSDSLEEHKAKGKFIKEFTNSLIRKYSTQRKFIELDIVNSIRNSYQPIDASFCWHYTAQGHNYWLKINDEISEKLLQERRRKNYSKPIY